jgi:prepilin-type N-terminal cleavage/methylation domain-containing protein
MSRKPAGFSLVELIMVITVLGILAAAAAPIVVNAMRAYDVTRDELATKDKLRYAMERLAREFREMYRVNGEFSISSLSATAPVFTKAATDPTTGASLTTRTVTIAQSGGAVTLSYDSPVVTPAPVLTDEVSSLSFAYYDSAGASTALSSALQYVEITMSLTSNGLVFTERTRVKLRNE